MQAARQPKPARKNSASAKASKKKPATRVARFVVSKEDRRLLSEIREAKKQGSETWKLVEMLMNHLLEKSKAEKTVADASIEQGKAELAHIINKLPPRQRVVLRLLRAGLDYKHIATELDISHATVRVVVAKLRNQLGALIVPVLRNDKSDHRQYL